MQIVSRIVPHVRSYDKAELEKLINSGGIDAVNAGATASGAIINNGTQFVLSGGTASGTTLSGAGTTASSLQQ